MGQFLVGMVIVMALAILVAIYFRHKDFAGLGCILALAIMSCGLLSAISAAILR